MERDINGIRREMRAAQDAWLAACAANTTGGETARLARISMRLEAEYRMAKLGKFRAVDNPCQRCGGYGGSSGWPGFVCFDCNGTGTAG